VDLPAFLLSKNVRPDPVRALRHSAEAFALWLLPMTRAQVRFRSLRTTHPPLLTTHPANKKPGVERRAKSPHPGDFARSSTVF
jgi:hypothetical protein